MRNKWLALAAGFLLLLMAVGTTVATEKSRDWKTGQVVESKSAAGPQIHTVMSGGKNYLVRGALGGDDILEVGSGVRFAVEGKTMFVSLEGREYRLNVVGETVAPQRDAELPPPAQGPPTVTPAPRVAAAAAAPHVDALSVEVPRVEPPRPAPPAAAAAPAKPAGGSVGANGMPDGARPEAVVDGTLDNDAVVKMVVGGLREETVVTVIQARPGKYNVTPEAQAALRVAGVPARVIGAMSAKMKP